ncbi:MAG: 5-formyltetrahydrofolate cyclo-ligase [Chitinophagaceae bacterium]
MTKKELRVLYKEKRKQLSAKDIMRLDDLLLIQFQQWPLSDIRVVLTYWPMSRHAEIDTQLMIDYLSFRIPDLQTALPVLDNEKKIFKPVVVLENTELLQNEFSIYEPQGGQELAPTDIDLVFVPLLAYNMQGFRVGYGKGFYDRFLASCRNDVIKIGFSYFPPEGCIDDINDFDVPLNLCITPNKTYEF